MKILYNQIYMEDKLELLKRETELKVKIIKKIIRKKLVVIPQQN